jgi:hypothetical protein
MCVNNYGFERICHIHHIRALLLLDSNDTKEARKLLEALLLEANNYPANRAIMWVRLTLAGLLRSQGLEAQALAIFSNIVKPIGNGNDITDEPEPPSQLRAAYLAVRVARDSGVQMADEQLRNDNLEWCSPQALWIICGGPAAEIS